MASDGEKAELRGMIEEFYRFANVDLQLDDVNDSVAAVFGTMLNETTLCSKAFSSIPTPAGGPPTVAWFVLRLGRGLFAHYMHRLSFTCARGVISRWNTQLQMAAMGISARRLPAWA